jgi:hypothetical protein
LSQPARPDAFGEEIDEHAHARGQRRPAEEQRMKGFDIAGIIIGEKLDQPAVGDLVGDVEAADARDADAVHRELDDGVAVVRLDDGGDGQSRNSRRLAQRATTAGVGGS